MTDTTTWVILLSLGILATIAILCFVLWLTWRASQGIQGVSPYTGRPLRRATDLPYFSVEKVFLYLHGYHQYDNSIFSLKKAAFCRETGRFFPNSVTWYNSIKVDWNFLRNRYPGHYVSWGSLTVDQQRLIRESHDSLDGYQTEKSCPNPIPRAVTPEYSYLKPGPLYVDFQTKVLLGWKVIPGTEFEVLIVQKPIK